MIHELLHLLAHEHEALGTLWERLEGLRWLLALLVLYGLGALLSAR